MAAEKPAYQQKGRGVSGAKIYNGSRGRFNKFEIEFDRVGD